MSTGMRVAAPIPSRQIRISRAATVYGCLSTKRTRDMFSIPRRERLFLRGAVLRLAHAVADASHCMDELHEERVVDLAPQVPYVDVDDIGDSLKTLIPNVIQDHSPGQHAIRRRQQVLQQRIFLVRQLDTLAAAVHLVSKP